MVAPLGPDDGRIDMKAPLVTVKRAWAKSPVLPLTLTV